MTMAKVIITMNEWRAFRRGVKPHVDRANQAMTDASEARRARDAANRTAAEMTRERDLALAEKAAAEAMVPGYQVLQARVAQLESEVGRRVEYAVVRDSRVAGLLEQVEIEKRKAQRFVESLAAESHARMAAEADCKRLRKLLDEREAYITTLEGRTAGA
jgi:hypothetical protein